FIHDFLGLPATFNNTFFVQLNGRNQLDYALHYANFKTVKNKLDPVGLVPEFSWPMVKQLATENFTDEYIQYEMKRDGLAREIKTALKQGPDLNKQGKVISFAYFNLPHNPTGYTSNPEEGKNILYELNQYNGFDSAEDKSRTLSKFLKQ